MVVADESEWKPTRDMLRTAVLAANRKNFQHPKLLVNRIKSLHHGTSSWAREKHESSNPQNLPHLPVPELSETLSKYLETVKPFTTVEEYNCTKDVVARFVSSCGPGKRLQEYLVERAKTHDNWLEQWWLDSAYLGYRDPVTIFSSPGQTLPFTRFEDDEDRTKYAAKLILASLAYKKLIDKKKIPVDKMGKSELDMRQYEKIFGTCRVPRCPKDELHFYPNSNYIVVVHNNHFFKLTVMDLKGIPLSERQLKDQLTFCISKSLHPATSVGLLTSQYRDTWSEAYEELIKDPNNETSVKTIQKSLFLVCLDQPTCLSTDNRLTVAMKQFIHGGSSSENSGNRWYDKTIQFILSRFGEVGLTYEHSPSEGQPVAVMVDFLHQHIAKDLGKDVPDSEMSKDPVCLKFEINGKLQDAIEAAAKNIDRLASNLDLTCFQYTKYGKEFIKTQNLSPDSYIQMALQCAFYKIHNKPGAHYESAATRMYIGGRTETIRSCSSKSIRFAQTLLDPNKSSADKVEALRDAVADHKKYTVAAVQGFGVDRHMLGLKIASGKLNMDLPELFLDDGWKRSSHMRISSSQVATNCDGLMGYAPLVTNGYGCCYNPRKDDMYFSVSAFEDYRTTGSATYKSSLEWCLDEMQKILVHSQKSKL